MTQVSPWSEEARALLRELKIAGRSHPEISRVLSEKFSRVFSIGMISSRLYTERKKAIKAGNRGDSVAMLRAPIVARAPQAGSGANFGRVNVEVSLEEAPRKTAPPDSIAKSPKPISHPDFCRHACKWPLMARDETGDYLLCQNASGGKNYCDEHRPYAYSASPPKGSAKSQAAAASIHFIRRSAA